MVPVLAICLKIQRPCPDSLVWSSNFWSDPLLCSRSLSLSRLPLFFIVFYQSVLYNLFPTNFPLLFFNFLFLSYNRPRPLLYSLCRAVLSFLALLTSCYYKNCYGYSSLRHDKCCSVSALTVANVALLCKLFMKALRNSFVREKWREWWWDTEKNRHKRDITRETRRENKLHCLSCHC